MKIETKYDIGHRYWVARCRKIVHEEEKEFDGHIWVREYYTFEPIAKQKEIVTIDVRHTEHGTSVVYGIGDVESGGLLRYYPEPNIENYTEEEANNVAQNYADNCEEYFGRDEQ